MTENEALELMKSLQISKDCELVKTLDFKATVIKALENLQQYRAIGTVEEMQSMKDNGAFSGVELAQLAIMQMRLKDYEAIGTVEEFKALKEKSVAKKVTNLQINKMQSFCEDDFGRKIPCTIKVFQFYCPNCNRKIASRFKINKCTNCNQIFDWE